MGKKKKKKKKRWKLNNLKKWRKERNMSGTGVNNNRINCRDHVVVGGVVTHVGGHEDDAWEVKLDMVEACGKSPNTILVLINPLAKTKIDLLMETYKSREWLAYLVGENNVVFDIVVPDQVASGVSVDNIEFEKYGTVIGVIHSHHGMGHKFSGIDDEWINQNHDISIVISHNGMKGQVRWKAPCGAMKIVPATIRLNIQVDYDKASFLKDAKEKIKAHTSAIVTGKDIQGRRIEVRSKYEPGKVRIETDGGWRYNPTTYTQERIVYIDWVDPADVVDGEYDPPKEEDTTQDAVDEIEQMIDGWDGTGGDITDDSWDTTTIDPDDISLENALDALETGEDIEGNNIDEAEEIIGIGTVNEADLPEGCFRDSKGCLRGPDGKFVKRDKNFPLNK